MSLFIYCKLVQKYYHEMLLCERKFSSPVKFLKNWFRNSGVLPESNGYSVNSTTHGNPINHRSMNGGQFNDSVCFLCLVGCVLTSWSLT